MALTKYQVLDGRTKFGNEKKRSLEVHRKIAWPQSPFKIKLTERRGLIYQPKISIDLTGKIKTDDKESREQ